MVVTAYSVPHGCVEPLSKGRIPYYVPLATEEHYEWVDDYLEEQGLRQSISHLRKTRGEFRQIKPQITDLRLKLEKSYSDYLDRQAQKFINFHFSENSVDPFARLDRNSDFVVIPFSFFERVLSKLETGGTGGLVDDGEERISESERLKEIAAIDKRIDEQRAKLAEITSQGYFMIDNATVSADARAKLVDHWRAVQVWISKPCNPQGIDLSLSPDYEIEAFKKLEIGKSISPKAKKLPYPRQYN